MKVLFITHHYLDGNSGGTFASRAYVNAFSEIADSCMLMYPDRGISVTKFIHKKCILKGVTYNRSKILKVIDIYRGRIHRYTDVMIPQINEFKPDIVVFDNCITSAGMLKKIKRPGLKIITIHHNYEFEYYQGTKPFIAWRIPFLYYLKEAESTAVQQSDLSLTLTEEDVILLQRHYDPHQTKKIIKLGCFESVSNSLGTDFKVVKENQALHSDLCFAITGSLGSYQTEVSVIPFLEDEYPELLKIIPGSKLIIAGRDPSNRMMKECAKYPSINLISNPENMQDVIAQADIYICPTCVGGGLKLRVMDGLKAGLPVLTHVVSARGYNDFEKANCLFSYENKYTFRKSLEKIIEKMNKGNLDGGTIKDLYNSVFSFESGVKRLKKILSENQMI
jgi:glycosyltransferase involved in cell wall biosynthesis